MGLSHKDSQQGLSMLHPLCCMQQRNTMLSAHIEQTLAVVTAEAAISD
jgi:hypothetical protein